MFWLHLYSGASKDIPINYYLKERNFRLESCESTAVGTTAVLEPSYCSVVVVKPDAVRWLFPCTVVELGNAFGKAASRAAALPSAVTSVLLKKSDLSDFNLWRCLSPRSLILVFITWSFSSPVSLESDSRPASVISVQADLAQETVGKKSADAKTPEDQLDALLREFDATVESNRRAAPRGNLPADKQAQVQGEFRPSYARIKGRLLWIWRRVKARTNAAERFVFLAAEVSFEPGATKARELLARDYTHSDRLKALLTRRLELYWASQGVEDLLRNVLEQNPYREIRGLACYWLAEVLTYRSQMLRLSPIQSPRIIEMWCQRFSQQDLDRIEKQDPKSLEEEIARLYERVITEFPFVQNNDTRTERPPSILGEMAGYLPTVAKVHLDELRRYSAGKPAPEIRGVDLDGKPMKLTDYRGKVVVLFVSGFGRPFAAPPERAPAHIVGILRQIAKSTEGKPVAFLGVVETNRELYKKEVEATGLPIRFWWDPNQERPPERGVPGIPTPRPGPILTAWDAEVPNWYVIDPRGVIRYTQVLGPDMLEKAVTTLLKGTGRGARQARCRAKRRNATP